MMQRFVECGAGRGRLVGQVLSTAQLAVVEVVVAYHLNRWRVDMDGDSSGLMIHAVDAFAGEPESLAWAVLARPERLPDGERLVPRSAFDHMDAHTRASVVVVAGVAWLPPQIEPRFRMFIAPQQHRLTGAGAVKPPGLDERGCLPGPFGAFVRCQRPVAGGDSPQPRCV